MNLRRRPESTMRVPESHWARLWRWIKGQVVGDVPQGDALCEFDCARDQCRMGEWAICQRRLAQGEGELWPGSEATKTRERRSGSDLQ